MEIAFEVVVGVVGSLVGGLFAFFIARYQVKQEGEQVTKLEAKYKMAELKLTFFENALDKLSRHEQFLQAIKRDYGFLVMNETVEVDDVIYFARETKKNYDKVEGSFREFLVLYHAKRFLLSEDEFEKLEEICKELAEAYQVLQDNVGISRIFFEKNCEYDEHNDLLSGAVKGTQRLRRITDLHYPLLVKYSVLLSANITVLENISREEINNLKKMLD